MINRFYDRFGIQMGTIEGVLADVMNGLPLESYTPRFRHYGDGVYVEVGLKVKNVTRPGTQYVTWP